MPTSLPLGLRVVWRNAMKRSLRAAAAAALTTLPLLACDHSATAPRLDQLTLDVVSGDGQTAVVGTQVGPLIVKVTSSGNPVPLQVLNFRVVAGGGSVYGGTELTDNDGIAQELWTLGTKASDVQKVEVRAVESSTGAEKVFATFTATALADKAAKLIAATGDNQAGLAGSAVTVAPAAEATDQYGNPIANVAVLFAVATGGGRATGLSQTTNTSGVATVGSWTLGTAAGTNTLTAGTPGLTLAGSPVTFTVVGTTGTAAQLVLVSGNNQSASPGTKLPQSATVQVVDANGNGVANVAVTFTVTSGGGSIDGVGSVTTLTSMGTSSMPPGSAAVNSTLGSAAGTNTLQATAVGLNGSPLGFTATAVSAKPLYVSNGGNNSITVYAAGANGNAAPTMTIAGSNTGLSGPQGIARDGAGNIYVANFNNSTITVYATGASGNATPTATIAGSNTGLNFVHGIAL